MKLWPFHNKHAPRLGTKSASYLFGPGALNLMQHKYEVFASEGYGLNPVVRRCVDLVANTMASVDIQARIRGKDGKLKDMPNHPVLALLSNPNPTQPGGDFRVAMACYYLISGNAYVYGVGIDPMLSKPRPPEELHLLKPGCVEVVKKKGAPLPQGYKYRSDGGDNTYPVNQINGMCAVMHKKTFNPVDHFIGLSPMTAAAFGIDVINEGSRWNLRLLQNEGRPSGAMVVKSADGKTAELSEEQYMRIREQVDQQFSGSNNAGRPLLLEGGLEWQEMSINPKDMDHEKNMNSSARRIALVYGVPPMMLGIPGDNTYSNLSEAKLALWTDTILPLLGSFLESLNNWLGPMYGDGVELWYDEEMIPALEPLRESKARRIEASSTMSINEKRRAMGMDDTPGGDTILVDSSKIPLELVGEMDLPEVGSNPTI